MVLTRSQLRAVLPPDLVDFYDHEEVVALAAPSPGERRLDALLDIQNSAGNRANVYTFMDRDGQECHYVGDLKGVNAKDGRKTLRSKLRAAAISVWGCACCADQVSRHGCKFGPQGTLMFNGGNEECKHYISGEETMQHLGESFMRDGTIEEVTILCATNEVLGRDGRLKGPDPRNPGQQYKHYTAGPVAGARADIKTIQFLDQGGSAQVVAALDAYTGGFADPKTRALVKSKLKQLLECCTPGTSRTIQGAKTLLEGAQWIWNLIEDMNHPFRSQPLNEQVGIVLRGATTGHIGPNSRAVSVFNDSAIAHFTCLQANSLVRNLVENAVSPEALVAMLQTQFAPKGVYQRSTGVAKDTVKTQKAIDQLSTEVGDVELTVMTINRIKELQREQQEREAPNGVTYWVHDSEGDAAAASTGVDGAARNAFAGVGARLASTREQPGMKVKGAGTDWAPQTRARPYSLRELAEHVRAGDKVFVDARREPGTYVEMKGGTDSFLRTKGARVLWEFYNLDGWKGRVLGNDKKQVLAVAHLNVQGFEHWMLFCEGVDGWLHSSVGHTHSEVASHIWRNSDGTIKKMLRSDMIHSGASKEKKQVLEEAGKSIPTRIPPGEQLAFGVGIGVSDKSENRFHNANLKVSMGTRGGFEHEIDRFEISEEEAETLCRRDEERIGCNRVHWALEARQAREVRAREERAAREHIERREREDKERRERENKERREREDKERRAREERIRRSRERPSLMRVCVCGERIFERRATFCCKCGTGLPGFTTEQQKELRRQHGDGACAQQ